MTNALGKTNDASQHGSERNPGDRQLQGSPGHDGHTRETQHRTEDGSDSQSFQPLHHGKDEGGRRNQGQQSLAQPGLNLDKCEVVESECASELEKAIRN
jgi:hypothetical protein